MKPRELMRRKEAGYREFGLANESLTRDDLIRAMVEHPIDRSDQALDNEGQILGQELVHVEETRKGHQLQAAAESRSGISRLAVGVAC